MYIVYNMKAIELIFPTHKFCLTFYKCTENKDLVFVSFYNGGR